MNDKNNNKDKTDLNEMAFNIVEKATRYKKESEPKQNDKKDSDTTQ